MECYNERAAKKLPQRPIHLHAELVYAEHDGISGTHGKVVLHTELEGSVPNFPVVYSIPDGEPAATVILIVRDDTLDFAADQFISSGFAVFTVNSRDVVSDEESVKTEYERTFMRGRAARRPGKAEILAWVTLRVAEYARTVDRISDEIKILDTVTGGACALIAESCDQALRAMTKPEYARA